MTQSPHNEWRWFWLLIGHVFLCHTKGCKHWVGAFTIRGANKKLERHEAEHP